MSSLYATGKENVKIQYVRNGRKTVLYLGKDCSLRMGKDVQRLLDTILDKEKNGQPVPEKTVEGLKSLPKRIRESIQRQKLFDFGAGLGVTMAGLKKITDKESMTEAIKYQYEKAWSRLLQFFSEDMAAEKFDRSACEAFSDFLFDDLGFADKTVHERFKSLRRSFGYAQSKGAILYNPFVDVRAGKDTGTPSVPVSVETVEKILPFCVDAETRLAMVFGRFAGVRIPSEIRCLRWDDIGSDRFYIRAGKTGSRIVPLFDRVAVELDKNRGNGSEWVFPQEHGRNYCRSYWAIRRAVERAGFEPWPKLLNSLRASCITDFAHKNFHEVTMNAIFGNSESVRKKHYIKVREEEYKALLQAGREIIVQKEDREKMDLLSKLLPLFSVDDLRKMAENTGSPVGSNDKGVLP